MKTMICVTILMLILTTTAIADSSPVIITPYLRDVFGLNLSTVSHLDFELEGTEYIYLRDGINNKNKDKDKDKDRLAPIPIPGAAWLMGPALLALFSISKKKRK